MDYNTVRMIVRETIWKVLQEAIDEKDCPVCKKNCTMIRLNMEPIDADLNTLKTDKYWRCLNCLNKFSDTLKKVS